MNTIVKEDEYQVNQIGVTEIDGVRWYTKGDQKYISVTEVLSIPKAYSLQNYYKKNSANKIQKIMETTADFGSKLHKIIEMDLKGIKVTIDDLALEKCFQNWLKLKSERKIKALLTEHAVVSEKYGFGGRIDYFGTCDNVLAIQDLKTGFFDNLVGLQLCAYRQAWSECSKYRLDELSVRGIKIHRNGSEPDVVLFEHLEWCFTKFLHALEVYKHVHFQKLDAMGWPYLKEDAVELYYREKTWGKLERNI